MSSPNASPAGPANAGPSNPVIAHTLHWLAVLLEIDEGEPKRVAAYREAAKHVRTMQEPLADVARSSGAAGLELLGFTPMLAATVTDWIRTGALPVFDHHRRTGGLWPALTRALCNALGIEPGERRPTRLPRLRPRGVHRSVWESWN